MSARLFFHLRRRSRLPGLLLAILAFVSQLAMGSVVLPDGGAQADLARLDAASILCLTDAPPQPHRQAPHHQEPDGALCPLDLALALPAIVLSSSPILPPPPARFAQFFVGLPTARGPPSHISHLGFPRGPPILT